MFWGSSGRPWPASQLKIPKTSVLFVLFSFSLLFFCCFVILWFILVLLSKTNMFLYLALEIFVVLSKTFSPLKIQVLFSKNNTFLQLPLKIIVLWSKTPTAPGDMHSMWNRTPTAARSVFLSFLLSWLVIQAWSPRFLQSWQAWQGLAGQNARQP